MSAIDQLIHSSLDSEHARGMVAELIADYSQRYADMEDFDVHAEMGLFPPLLFTPPYGDFLLIRRGNETIAGGAFMYLDEETAEIKRVWTSSQHRRQGLSRTIMSALEREIAERGYRRIYLTTGPRQPEAKNMYLGLGYTPLFDLAADPETIGHLAFEKEIIPGREGILIEDEQLAARQRAMIEDIHTWYPAPEVRLRDLP
ncbi:GNAT family N-acetyltransferase [Corynebacterium sp. A21]|uniref:GNAT family N-acetyltransferase n=1 Tax=Corynebacterium sp. A21 TaxID=3457318 RepID=UPI003FD111A3